MNLKYAALNLGFTWFMVGEQYQIGVFALDTRNMLDSFDIANRPANIDTMTELCEAWLDLTFF